MVGVIQFSLGAVKLGTVVNFVSHPVILGFMNAAAIIIALSQLDNLLGIPKSRSDSFLKDIWEMLGYLPQAHLPTLAMSAFALALMLTLKKIPALSKLSVLIAVVITILVSVIVGYDQKSKAEPAQIMHEESRALVEDYINASSQINDMVVEVTERSSELRALTKSDELHAAASLKYGIDITKLDIAALKKQNHILLSRINTLRFVKSSNPDDESPGFYLDSAVPPNVETDDRHWRIKKIDGNKVKFIGGGDVVGSIPQGLPSFRMPDLSMDAILSLLSAAFVIALVAFMESISMAKAMAAKTRQRLDPNQELIGQGLANMGGSLFQAYPACGSFTGSAINLQAGAKTGFAMVFNATFVMVVLLFLTQYLYDLPKAVLAVIILLAVTSLITPKMLIHTWKASRTDGIVAIATFVVTLVAAPHLDKGVMVGAGLAILLHLYRTMKPRVVQLGRYVDGTLRDIKVNPTIPTSPHIIAMRFDGCLYFANVAYFEDTVLEQVANRPDAKYLLVSGGAINTIDSSGEEVIHHLVKRLRQSGTEVVFCGLKKQVLDVMRATGLFDLISQDNIFPNEDLAIRAISNRIGPDASSDLFCAVQTKEDAVIQDAEETQIKEDKSN
jgi:SulP family sulfate permease